jgi:hypothetical protein
MNTGHPVMIVVVVVVAGMKVHAMFAIRIDDDKCDMFWPAFMMMFRNNEMIELFAKYFL